MLERAVWGWPYFELWIASLLALHSLCSTVSPEQLDFIGSLETPYCQYGSQGGTYQLSQHPQQHQCSQFHHLPFLQPSNVSSIHLTSTTPTKSSAAFLAPPGSTGMVTYGPAGDTQGYVQNHVGEQPVLQWQNGNAGKFLKSWHLTPQECHLKASGSSVVLLVTERKKECVYTCIIYIINCFFSFSHNILLSKLFVTY